MQNGGGGSGCLQQTNGQKQRVQRLWNKESIEVLVLYWSLKYVVGRRLSTHTQPWPRAGNDSWQHLFIAGR